MRVNRQADRIRGLPGCRKQPSHARSRWLARLGLSARLLTIAFACTLVVPDASAQGTLTRFGVHFDLPVPAKSVGARPLGAGAGVNLDQILSPEFGVGAEASYHFWPASPDYRAAYDDYLRSYLARVIDSPDWAFHTVGFMAYAVLLAPTSKRLQPWFQLGAGQAIVDRNLSEPVWEPIGVVVVERRKREQLAGTWTGRMGIDTQVSPTVALGLIVSYHHISGERERVPAFSAWTVGTRFRFGK